ncbi:AraC-like DNA-binding protein [Motilibacter rhizosphaerae]|uniref:AraC-like DNA-binding protein n=1 Tax=Motilibacter rhizosphaerae TaxID=598652 RepID=A0A4Q7NWN8_9ACTN|nr:AraC family transcriptional regulator [Motilibacter rhizosphaerae]RZS91617.1 AraC-like DNA-binding protein [Motilibacter rhizosphaerae]
MGIGQAGAGIWQVPYAPPGILRLPVELLSFRQLRAMDPGGRRRRPQRPAFHVLALVESGSGAHRADFVDHPLGPRTVVHLRPGVVHQWSDVDAVDGLLVLFTPAAADLPSAYGPASSTSRADDAEWRLLRAATAHLRREWEAARTTPAPSGILEHTLAALVLRADALGSAVAPGEEHAVFRSYREAVEEHFRQWRQVSDYASSLGWSPRTLSRATRAAAGVGAKRFLDQRVALEAKRLLAHTDMTVAQCAAALGFSQPAGFTAFFTAHTGLAPRPWRERERGDTQGIDARLG